MKIIDKIRRVLDDPAGTVVSFEFFPAKTEEGVDNLLVRVEDMAFRLQPTFVTLTWRSAFKDEELWLRIGAKIQKKFGVDVLLHLTCHLPVEDLRRVLRRAREAGIQNILALRGDPPIGEASWRPVAGGLANAVELVRLIREEHGDYFCVAVAAYPETHIECWNHEDLPPSEQSRLLDLERLKAKVDAGADFIITQFFYDVDMYLEFVERCRALGIACPILPGYMPIQTYKGFCKFTKWCRTRVPEFVLRDLEDIAENDEAVKAYGIDLGIRTCRALLHAGTRALHFYTMNLALSVSKILEALDLVPKAADRTTPWAGTAGTLSRPREEVRPIFWANRAASYLSRTAEWDEYPNGRWGDSRSPAYGDLTDYYLAFKRPLGERRALWGTPASEADIVAVFVRYLEGTVPQLPWCESNLAAESGAIFDNLHWLNRHGFLTINSQPKVNGLPSSDDKHGWGGSDGFVFQKAYLEFFVKPDLFERFVAAIPRYPSLTFHAINRRGDEVTNLGRDHDGAETVNAVTWGVFPGREIIQPTVVDPVSFRAWKDEAFGLWVSQWAATYDKDTPEDVRAREVIGGVVDSYWLVNVVDNAYAEEGSDIFAIFKEVVADAMSKEELRATVRDMEAGMARFREQLQQMRDLARLAEDELKAATERAALLERENLALRSRLREVDAASILSGAAPSLGGGGGGGGGGVLAGTSGRGSSGSLLALVAPKRIT